MKVQLRVVSSEDVLETSASAFHIPLSKSSFQSSLVVTPTYSHVRTHELEQDKISARGKVTGFVCQHENRQISR